MSPSRSSRPPAELTSNVYRQLVESVQDYAIFVLDVDGHITTWNAGAERIKGYTAQEIIGQHFSVFYPPEDVAAGKLERELEEARTNGRVEDEGWRVRKDGTRIWASVVITALRDGNGTLTGYGKVTRDLTQRRQAEEELMRSEERFRLLIEGVGDHALYMLDANGHVTTWNTGAQTIKGFTAREIIGRHFSAFFAPEAVAAGAPHRELAVAASTGRFEEEGWRIRKDGSRFWANVVLTAIHGADGNLLGFAKITRDLTARRAAEETERQLIAQQAARNASEEAEQRLRDEGERYRALSRKLEVILESVADGITVQDRAGKLLFANTAAAQSCGFASVDELLAATGAEILGRFEVLTEDGAPLDPDQLPGRRALRTGESTTVTLKARNLRTDTISWYAVRSRAALGSDGTPEIAVNIWHDITEEHLRDEHSRYLARATAALSSSLDYTAMLSTLADLLVPSLAEWCAVHLLNAGELQSVAVAHADPEKVAFARELQRKFPADPQSSHGLWATIRTKQPQLFRSIDDQLLAARARGPEHLSALQALQMKSAMVVPVMIREQVLGTITLVSTQSNYDQADLTLAQEIGRRAGVALENARLFGVERDASRIKDEFLATVSHELRTPLNAIVGWSSLLRDGRSGQDLAKGIEVIHRNALAQAKIIEDILDVSRIITGKLGLDLTACDLVATVRNAIDVVGPSAAAKSIDIELRHPQEPCVLVADHARLQQVAWNLLSNAVKFTDNHGKVIVTIAREGSKIEMSVTDTGRGIDAEFLPHVFERFKQADGSIARRFGGLGLGLAIVRHIVEIHGGQVRAESSGFGQGATFTLVLPVRAIAPQLQVEDAPSSSTRPSVEARRAPSLRGVRVLVVDDEADARELLEAVLIDAGATVETAASASAGIERLQQLLPHVLVSDVGMPDEDGYAFMRRVRQLPASARGNVPAIALTAYARRSDKMKALEVGFTTHLGKPVNPNELVAAVAKLAHSSTTFPSA